MSTVKLTVQASSRSTVERTFQSVKWRHFLVAPCVFLHIFAYVLADISIKQYTVHAIHRMRYPNETANITSNDQAICGQNSSTPEHIHQQRVQAEAAIWNIYATMALCIPGIVSNLIFGAYIDRFGRKLLFITALVGTVLKSSANMLGIYFELNIYIFIVFFVFEGITGMWVGTLSAAFSYVADITQNGKNRSFAITLMEMCLGIAAFTGNLTSGYIIQSLGFMYTFGISAACTLFGLVMVVSVLPETSTKSTSVSVGLLRNINHALSFYVSKNNSKEGQQWKYIICLAIFTLVGMANIGNPSVRVLYLLNIPFCWTSVTIGWYSAVSSISHQIIGMATIKLLQSCFSDASIALFGSISNIAGVSLLGLATSNTVLYLAVAVGFGSNVPIPMTRAIMSKMTPADKQGSMFAGLAAMEAVCNLAGSVSANAVYTATVTVYRGMVFFVLGSYSAIATVLIIILIVVSKAGATEPYINEITVNIESKDEPSTYGSLTNKSTKL